jgi:Cys-tRNA(Pro)/Cys-tRNA(Cys) deacylase
MKKKYPIFYDETSVLYDRIGVSAGVRGCQIVVRPEELVRFTEAVLCDVARF